MEKYARAAGFVVLCLCLFVGPVLALDLREFKNDIHYSESAHAFGINSGNLIVTEGDSLLVYNIRLEAILSKTLKPGQKLEVAENGLYYGIITPLKSDDRAGPQLQRIDIYDKNDKNIWSFDGLAMGDCHIAPSGDYLVFASGTEGGFDWRIMVCNANQTGAMLDLVACKEIKFASDGSRFVIDGGPKGIFLYDKTGKRLKALDYQQGFAISATGKYLAVLKDGTLTTYSDTTVLSVDSTVDREIVAFNINEKLKRLYYVAPYTLASINIERGVKVWDYKMESAKYRFTSIDLSMDNRFIACGVIVNLGSQVRKDERHPNGYIYMFDIGRNFFRKVEFPNTNWTPGQPEVGFWPDGRSILVRTNDRILTFEMI